jgi:hypothetical protein
MSRFSLNPETYFFSLKLQYATYKKGKPKAESSNLADYSNIRTGGDEWTCN